MRRRRASAVIPGDHFLVPGSMDGWFVCACGCGYVAVCRHCVPTASQQVGTVLCDAEERRLGVGVYAPEEGKREGNA